MPVADTVMRVTVIGLIGMAGYGLFATTTSLYALKKFNRNYDLEMKKKEQDKEKRE